MKQRFTALLLVLVLAAILGVLQQFAFAYYLYWKFWWYDVMMHFLGGAVLGSICLWLLHFEVSEKRKKKFLTYPVFILAVFTLGVVWEVYEVLIKANAEYSEAYWVLDTLKDLCMDTLGGSVAYWVVKQISGKNA